MHLIAFVEEETEISENDPKLLPAARVLELAQQKSTQLVLHVTTSLLYTLHIQIKE